MDLQESENEVVEGETVFRTMPYSKRNEGEPVEHMVNVADRTWKRLQGTCQRPVILPSPGHSPLGPEIWDDHLASGVYLVLDVLNLEIGPWPSRAPHRGVLRPLSRLSRWIHEAMIMARRQKERLMD